MLLKVGITTTNHCDQTVILSPRGEAPSLDIPLASRWMLWLLPHDAGLSRPMQTPVNTRHFLPCASRWRLQSCHFRRNRTYPFTQNGNIALTIACRVYCGSVHCTINRRGHMNQLVLHESEGASSSILLRLGDGLFPATGGPPARARSNESRCCC